MTTKTSRRSALRTITGGAVALAAATTLPRRCRALRMPNAGPNLKGRVHHSVCRWCYDKIPLDDLCAAAKDFGLQSIDLIEAKGFPDACKKHGLICAMWSPACRAASQADFNRTENHDKIVEFFEQTIPIVAEQGYPNIICFSGNRNGMSDEQGLENCATGHQAHHADGRKPRRHGLHGTAQQPAHAQGLYGATTPPGACKLCKRVGSGPFQAALRHLPHADHGRRPHSPLSRRTTSISAIIIPVACRDVAKSTRRRKSTTPP